MLVQLQPRERRALIRETWRILAGERTDWPARLSAARRVSFVCHGNIIRSPFAASAFRDLMNGRGVHVVSSGVNARAGESPDPRAAVSAAGFGLSLEGHRATLLDAEQVREANVLFVMDLANLGRVLGRYPTAAGKVFLLGGCASGGRLTLTEIRDPVSGTLDDVRQAHTEVLAAVRRLVEAVHAQGA